MKLELAHGALHNLGKVLVDLSVPAMYEEIIRNGEATLAEGGPVVADTGKYTGRSPTDKYVVRDPETDGTIWWEGGAKPMTPERFERLLSRQAAYLQGRKVYVRHCHAGADPTHRLPLQIVTECAWHNLFASNMFIDAPSAAGAADRFTLVHTPGLAAQPELDGTRSEVFIAIDFSRRMVLIGGTSYAGEMKKSIFTVLNYLLPAEGVLGMHCSANVGAQGDVAVFFGLSGTGKTTLSADPERALIGDDEHGWSDSGIFNFEGGCYAKVIRLSAEAEPEIYATTRQFGTVLENVVIDPRTRQLDLDDATLTENTRASYPLTQIPNIVPDGCGGHPKSIVMLTCDAFGVLPPIARLTPAQAMYHFISGYTAKVAGTERGVTEPAATFSSCFGAPFMARHPGVYAKLLGERMGAHEATCWLVNTGWSGGPYGVGERMPIAYSRALVRAALSGDLDAVPTRPDPVFGFEVPERCPGVPAEALRPRDTWSDKGAYDEAADRVAAMFQQNFLIYDDGVADEVKAAGPREARRVSS